MKTLKFNKKSWHYKLMKLFSGGFDNCPTDFCSYFWRIVRNILFSIMIAGALSLVLWILISFYNLFFGILEDIHYNTLIILGVSVGFSSLFMGIAFMLEYFVNRKDRVVVNEKVDSFIKTAWEAFHNKVCFKIEFKD